MGLMIALSGTLLCGGLFGAPAGGTHSGCFSIVAGRKATADGSVLFGHNEDNGPRDPAGLLYIPRRYHPSGTYLRLPGGSWIKQVSCTYSHLCLRMPHGPNSDVLLNEWGVAVASNNCPSREEEGTISGGGIGGPLLRHLVAQRARSARQGVQIVGSLVERFGYTASGRTLVIVDPNEGWLVALVRGKHYVAQRVPDHTVAVIANTYTIGPVELRDSRNFLGSADLGSYAERRSWHLPHRSAFWFEAAYASPTSRHSLNNIGRVRSAMRRLAPVWTTVPKKPPFPFSFKPKAPLRLEDIKAVLRDHYEGTGAAPGSGTDPHTLRPIPICRSVTNSSTLFHLRSDLPPQVGCVWHLALWQPCSTPYMPIFCGMREVPPSLGFGPARQGPLPAFGEAYGLFAELAKWVNAEYAVRHPLVRKRFKRYEEKNQCLIGFLQGRLSGKAAQSNDVTEVLLTRLAEGSVEEALRQARAFLKGDSGPGRRLPQQGFLVPRSGSCTLEPARR